MKIKYEFADGDVEVDVPNEWASILVELDRLERNNDKKERRRHYSLDSCVYEGIVYASEDKNLTAIFETDSKFGRLTEAIKYLSDKQKSLIKAVYFDGMSVSDYAKHMGISQSAVSQQLKTIYKKLKKFLIEKKIPATERDKLPMIAKEQEIIWIPGYFLADCVKITETTRRFCLLQCFRK